MNQLPTQILEECKFVCESYAIDRPLSILELEILRKYDTLRALWVNIVRLNNNGTICTPWADSTLDIGDIDDSCWWL